MNQLYRLPCHLVLTIALVTFGLVPVVAQATPLLTYELLPGSTITPVAGATPTGPTEALSGWFRWDPPHVTDSGFDSGFDAVALFFSSASFTITLNQTDNDLQSFLSPHTVEGSSEPMMNFAEVVDLTGLTIGLGDLSGRGTYQGPFSAPTFLSLPLLHISPREGGPNAADLRFSASLVVPEPPSWILSAALALTVGLHYVKGGAKH